MPEQRARSPPLLPSAGLSTRILQHGTPTSSPRHMNKNVKFQQHPQEDKFCLNNKPPVVVVESLVRDCPSISRAAGASSLNPNYHFYNSISGSTRKSARRLADGAGVVEGRHRNRDHEPVSLSASATKDHAPTGLIAVALVACLIKFLYASFAYLYLAPLNFPSWKLGSGILIESLRNSEANRHARYPLLPPAVLATVFHVGLGCLLIAYWRSVWTHPGLPPELEEVFEDTPAHEREAVKHVLKPKDKRLPKLYVACSESKRTGCKRWCKHCQNYKPDRTHHCRVCNECVLRMDHHCVWIANCVGFRNQKFFYNILWWGMLCSGLIFVCLFQIHGVDVDADEMATQGALEMLLSAAIWISLGTFTAVALLFILHTWLLVSDVTTIEMCEGCNGEKSEYVPASARLHRDAEIEELGTTGKIHFRLAIVLGRDWWFWLIPTHPDLRGDGMNYLRRSPTPNFDSRSIDPRLAP